MNWIIIIIITACISSFIVYSYLKPRLKAVQKLNESIIQTNSNYQKERDTLKAEISNLIMQKDSTLEQIQNLNNSIITIEKQAQEAADLFYKSKMETAQEHLEQALEIESQKYQQNIENFNIQYNENVSELMKQYQELENNITLMKATNDAAVAAAKRAEEMKDSQNYYKIQLSSVDISEISLLRQVEPHLRNKEPLNKVIWKCYYEKPTNDLIGRVIGSGIHTGIYKITEIETSKCYIGQSVNLSDRWKQHIKRGIGAETPTRNKLYPAMNVVGPENFTFEVIEECDRALLDEREKYWTDYFKAQEFGFSIKKG